MCHPAIGGQKKPGRECGLARIAVLGQRVSDNNVLCQPELNLQAGLDICPQLG